MKGLQGEHVRGTREPLDIASKENRVIYLGTRCTTAGNHNRARYNVSIMTDC